MPQMTVQQVFEMAVGHHQRGQLQAAEHYYRQILRQQPGHVDALHLAGVIAYQTGRLDAAVDLIGRALAINPNFPEAHSNLGAALAAKGLKDEAAAAYRRAIALKANYPDAHNNLGNVLRELGQTDEAIAEFRRAIALQPKYPEAHCNLGIALKDKGLWDEAIGEFRKAAELNPKFADAWSNLGAALKGKGELNEAIASLKRAIELQPKLAEAHYNLGNAYYGKGQLEESMAAFRAAIELRPTFAEAYYNLGNALRDAKQVDEAIAAYRQAIAFKADYAEAYGNLGIALGEKGQTEDAVGAFLQALAIKPNFPEAHNNLGNVHRDAGRPDDAIAAYRQAVALNPGYAEAHSNLGNVYKDVGRFEEAIAAFREAIALNGNLADAHSNLGIALRDMGQFEEATASLHRAMELNPEVRVQRALVSMRVHARDEGEFERLKAQLKQDSLSAEDRVGAEFALGKMLNELEDFDEAFGHFAEGNRLFKEMCAAEGERFDADQLRSTVDAMVERFTPEFFAARRAWGNSSELPVFIVGMPRSGTTLVEQISASHPLVHGAGELASLEQLSLTLYPERKMAPGSSWSFAGEWNAEWVGAIAGTYDDYLRKKGGEARRVTDKLPANVFNVGLIAVMFPNARVIFTRRDPRDNCLSCFSEQFARHNLLYTYDLADCGRQYVETDRLVRHWLKVLPIKMLEMQYEALVAEPEAQSRRLIDFLGLEWDPACLDFHRTKRPVRTASVWQVRQPMYNTSAGRWRHYEKHLGPLLEVLGKGAGER